MFSFYFFFFVEYKIRMSLLLCCVWKDRWGLFVRIILLKCLQHDFFLLLLLFIRSRLCSALLVMWILFVNMDTLQMKCFFVGIKTFWRWGLTNSNEKWSHITFLSWLNFWGYRSKQNQQSLKCFTETILIDKSDFKGFKARTPSQFYL